jgi:formylglycine-generating enzyme required for sulfatase activity
MTRARAADRLADLGDPRFDPACLHLSADRRLGFVQIPADPHFRIGTRSKDIEQVAKARSGEIPKDEVNDCITPTSEFYIAKYPVTVGQFGAFVAAADFRIGDQHGLRDPPTRPVRWVSWHEALAYCEWLQAQLETSPLLIRNPIAALVRLQGWKVTLPSELEWEVAARGGLRHAVFPWGNEADPNRANYYESGTADTSAVGCFPPNGFGLHDMVGNVWEWTRSLWGRDHSTPEFTYPYDEHDARREDLNADDDVLRILRGGAFDRSARAARCCFRYWVHAAKRFNCIGFRVVLRGGI